MKTRKIRFFHIVMCVICLMVSPPLKLLASANDIQQSAITVKGGVVDQDGETLPGVSIAVKGTTNGIMSDIDGKYTIGVPSKESVLTISYIGYVSQDVKVGDRTTIDVILHEDSQQLDEVVVVGYGVQKKANLTGAVSSIDFSEQAKSRPITSVSSALAGLSSGVTVMQTSGQPGSDNAKIRIRGVGTLNDNSPLVLVDGMEASMDNVNPNDIESISILKDAASASIYGSRAGNGVILITTKRGKGDGKPTVSFSTRLSITKPTNLIKSINNYAQYMEYMNEAAFNSNMPNYFSQETIDLWREKSKDPNGINEYGYPNYVAYPNTDWQKVMFKDNEILNEQNISVSGSGKTSRYLLSVGYLNNPGLVDNTGMTRYSLRMNVESDITKWLTVGTRTFASKDDYDIGTFKNANNFLTQVSPGVYPEYNGIYGGAESLEESWNASNMIRRLNTQKGNQEKLNFNTTMFSRVQFMEGLTWDVNFNYKRYWYERDAWTNPKGSQEFSFSRNTEISPVSSNDVLRTSFESEGNYSYTLENLLNYNRTFAKDHAVSALLGYQEFYYKKTTHSATKQGLIDESIHVPDRANEMISIGGNATDRASRSFFGRATYAFKSRYLFEFNARYDGHSRFQKDYRWGTFPSISAGWRLSEEAFMEGTRTWLDNLKIRASWGKLGNDGGDDVGNYEYQSVYSGTNYSFQNQQYSGLAITSIANSMLQWEATKVVNLGIDGNFLNQRLSFEFDVFSRQTDGILYRPAIYITAGNKTAPRLNLAEVKNDGFEFTLGWQDHINDFNYSVSANFGYTKNKVSKYKGTLKEGWVINADGKQEWQTNLGDVSNGSHERIIEGHPVNEYYLRTIYKGSGNYFNADGKVNPNGGPTDGMIRTEADMKWIKAMIDDGYQFFDSGKTSGDVKKEKLWYGDYIYADLNGDKVYGSDNDRRFTGYSSTPKYNFGFQLYAQWKGFDLSTIWSGAAGFKLLWQPTTGYNSTLLDHGRAVPANIALNHYFYDPENPSDPRTNINGKYPRLVAVSGNNHMTTDQYLFKGDYLKLKNLTVGYTIPRNIANRLLTQSIRVYFSGENLFSIDSYPGQDPEMGVNPEYTTVRQFSFGANITF